MKHKWSHSDDILTFYLFRYGEKEPVTQVGVARHMGFTDVGSLKVRIKNFAAIDGQKGLANYARLSYPASLIDKVFAIVISSVMV